MTRRLGAAAPAPGDPETEALRRFRSFAASSLVRGQLVSPSLEGLRPVERRVVALLQAWSDAALEVAPERADALKTALAPLIDHFRVSLRSTRSSRRARGAPRAVRRAVSAAIDRVADAFLAIDTDSGAIEDANPAAGALLGVKRDALLGVPATHFVAPAAHSDLWSQLDALSEGADTGHFTTTLVDTRGVAFEVSVSASSFTTRSRTLALLLARPKGPITGA